MASYEESAGAVIGAIDAAAASGAISQETADAINDLIADLQGQGVDQVGIAQIESGALTDANAVAGDQIVMMGEAATANVTFAPDSTVKAIVVGGGGNSNVVFETSDDVTVQLQGGQGDTVATGDGNDAITFTGGSATIDTGEGNDVVVLQGGKQGTVSEVSLTTGSGDGVVEIQSLVGNATIDAGEGFDRVNMISSRLEHVFKWIAGKFTMHSDAELTMDGVNVVTFDTDGDAQNSIDEISVLATTQGQSLIARLYKVGLGREAIDDANGWLADGVADTLANHQMGGLNWWLDEGGASDAGVDLTQLGTRFLDCEEFHNKYDSMSDAQYVQALFTNMGATDTSGLQGFVDALSAGTTNRYQVAIDLAQSAEATQILGVDGSQYVIDAPTA